MASPIWTVAAASVRGRGHEQTGTPCQDSSEVIVSPNGQWVALAASDGAGTARRSEIGADLVAREFAKGLIRLSEECDRRAPGAWVSDRVIQDIVALRSRLREQSGSDDISDFHCTLTAALIGPTGGVTVHLGDGAIFGGAADSRVGDVIDLARDFFVSAPQNGEYANETVFLTERDWVKHLRIQPVAAVDWVMLGTDGGMSLAMVGESKPKSGFVVPVIRALIQQPNFPSRCKALERILDDRNADRLTNDDKTLIVAIRSQYRDVAGEFGPAAPPSAAATPTVPPGTAGVVAPMALPAATGTTPSVSDSAGSHAGAGRRSRAHRVLKGKPWLKWLFVCIVLTAVGVGVWLLISRSSDARHVVPPATTTPKPKPPRAEKAVEPDRDKPASPAIDPAPVVPLSTSEASTAEGPALPVAPAVVGPPEAAEPPLDAKQPKNPK
jgi:hypothetical protein